ncbi:SDR family NAD(P)-dependent oxidoreductase, partial [bacterium]|nr:SDR family NAD(P)-dependent oxidoreductase [bacterium]
MSETARRIALVTGGSRGIGKAICERLGRDGIHLLINYRSNSVAAEETLENIRKSGGSGELLPFDVSDRKSIEKVLTEWHEKNRDDYISLLVNNAGITRDSMLMWMQDEEWHDVIDTNLHSVFYITRFLIKNMLMNKYGRIVNVVSLSGQKGLPGQVNYSAAKAGVIGAT